MGIEDRELVEASSLEEWRTWLAGNHATADGCWLVFSKVNPGPSYDEAVTEGLCWGWIDSQQRRIDNASSKLMFTPRKKGSGWSASNKKRLAELEPGRMQPAGQAVIDAALTDGTWTLLDSVEALEVPDDLASALEGAKSRAQFDSFPPSARKMILTWIATAKTAETRARRVTTTAEKAAKGERVVS